GLPPRERAFIAWMAPRGIVAAATSSTFALGLTQAGIGGGSQELIPITFIVIVATGPIYGLTGGPGAKAPAAATPRPRGAPRAGRGTAGGRRPGRPGDRPGPPGTRPDRARLGRPRRRLRRRRGRRARRLPRRSLRRCGHRGPLRARPARLRPRRRRGRGPER